MNNPPDFWRRDYPFQIACVQPPPPLRKNRRRSVCGEDATVHRLVSDGWSNSSYSVKTANNKIPASSVFNDSEGLYETIVCRCLVRRPHYSVRLMRLGSRGPSEFANEIGLTEIAWVDAVQGLGMEMSTVASETNREMLLIGNVFYKLWHLCVLFHWCFEGTTAGKLQILVPSKKPHFRSLVPRESAGNGA